MNLHALRTLAIFSREGDRFTHCVVQRQESLDEAVGLCGVLGSSLEDWPLAPPIQQLVLEQIGSPPRTVALGVGMSGSGHWSLAAETIRGDVGRQDAQILADSIPQDRGIQMDWACRIHRPAERLGSSYKAFGPMNRIAHAWTSQRAEWLLPNDARFVLNVAEGRIVWDEHESIVSIVPVSDIRCAGTHTWRYCLDVV
jgi:hypothetical protein